jgi:hypothetical protein
MTLTADPPPDGRGPDAVPRTERCGRPAGPVRRGGARIQASVNISSTEQVQVDPFMQLFYGADPTEPGPAWDPA